MNYDFILHEDEQSSFDACSDELENKSPLTTYVSEQEKKLFELILNESEKAQLFESELTN